MIEAGVHCDIDDVAAATDGIIANYLRGYNRTIGLALSDQQIQEQAGSVRFSSEAPALQALRTRRPATYFNQLFLGARTMVTHLPSTYEDLPPEKGAAEGLHQLTQKTFITFAGALTLRPDNTKETTAQWWHTHGFPETQEIRCVPSSKAKVLYLLDEIKQDPDRPVVLIDDRLGELASAAHAIAHEDTSGQTETLLQSLILVGYGPYARADYEKLPEDTTTFLTTAHLEILFLPDWQPQSVDTLGTTIQDILMKKTQFVSQEDF